MHNLLVLLRRIALFFLGGAALGDVASLLVAPSFIAWFQTPGVGGALCNCKQVAEESARALIHFQLTGAAVGGISLAVVGELGFRLLQKRKAQRQHDGASAHVVSVPPPSTPAPPSG